MIHSSAPFDPSQVLSDLPLVAFDTETSGAYPIGSDVVEFGAVRWHRGRVEKEMQFLFRPRERMSDFIIGIHGITNEMVASAPPIQEKISEVFDFLSGAVLFAHHAPFDQGFLAYEFERHLQRFPPSVVLCTSLLSRKLIPESPNHKLQTLIRHLKIESHEAHRALADAQACLQVGLECVRRLGEGATLGLALEKQGKDLSWSKYSLLSSDSPHFLKIQEAILNKVQLEIVYDKGSRQGQTRRVRPWGIVRNPDGDYMMALCLIDQTNKRFYLSAIREAEITWT